MDASSKEEQQPNDLSEKKLDEWFHPFDKNESPVYKSKMGNLSTEVFFNDLSDKLGNHFFIIPMGSGFRSRVKDVFTPFKPDYGYQVTNEDQQLESRIAKGKLEEQNKIIDDYKYAYGRPKFTFMLHDLYKKGGIEKAKELWPFIQRFRLQIQFPGSPADVKRTDPEWHTTTIFEARPNTYDFGKDRLISFKMFYPLDTGPLPSADPEEEKDYMQSDEPTVGLGFKLPDDLEKLEQIKIKLILLPEDTNKTEKWDDHENDNGENKVPKVFHNAFADDR